MTFNEIYSKLPIEVCLRENFSASLSSLQYRQMKTIVWRVSVNKSATALLRLSFTASQENRSAFLFFSP